MCRCCRCFCTKARVVFTWGLLECMSFGGLLMGWNFIHGIFIKDHYFISSSCSRVLNDSDNLYLTTASTPADERNKAAWAAVGALSVTHGLRNDGVNDRNETQFGNVTVAAGSQVREVLLADLRVVGERNTSLSELRETCLEDQNEALTWVYLCAILLTGVLAFPIGVLYDRYGTLKVRILAIVLFTVSTLMITFSSNDTPWLLFPAMTALGLSGSLLLVTNLQTSNLLIYRVTAILLYHAACDTGGFVQFLVQSSAEAGLNVQSSYMFMTIGLVPMLIGTIAFLPKRRVPWPLPKNYQEAEDTIRAYVQRNSPRSKQHDLPARFVLDFSATVGPNLLLFLSHVTWAAIMLLRIRAFELDAGSWCEENYYRPASLEKKTSHLGMCIYGAFQPCACAICLLLGLVLDRQMKTDNDEEKCNSIMRNYTLLFLAVTCMGLVFSSLLAMGSPEIIVYVILSLHVTLRILVPAISVAFLYTVLPHTHFGKHYGFTMAAAAVLQAVILYPIKFNVVHANSSRALNITYACLTALCLLYPALLWIKYRGHQFQVRSTNEEVFYEAKAPTYVTESGHTDTLIPSDDCPTTEENAF